MHIHANAMQLSSIIFRHDDHQTKCARTCDTALVYVQIATQCHTIFMHRFRGDWVSLSLSEVVSRAKSQNYRG